MAGQTWSVMIVAGSPCASFVPDVYGTTGSTLKAQTNDVVCWNNQTNEEHQPWPLTNGEPDETGPGLSDPIAAYRSSSPAYVVQATAGQTIDYCCRFHPDERGAIEVVA